MKQFISLLLLAFVLTGCTATTQDTNNTTAPSSSIDESSTPEQGTVTFSNDIFALTYPNDWHHVTETSVIPNQTQEYFGDTKPPYENSYFGMVGRDYGTLITIWKTSENSNGYLFGDTIISEEEIEFKGHNAKKLISEKNYPENIGQKFIQMISRGQRVVFLMISSICCDSLLAASGGISF